MLNLINMKSKTNLVIGNFLLQCDDDKMPNGTLKKIDITMIFHDD